MDSGLAIYHLVVWSNFNFLHNSQWITFPIQSSIVLYSFCASLLHSLMELIILSLSIDNLHLLFCHELLIFPLILLVLMTSYVAAIRRDSVSFVSFPFHSHVQIFLCEIWPVCYLKYPYSCFSCHFFPVLLFVTYVVTAVNGNCNWSFFALFNAIFKSLCWCINTILNAGVESSFPFFPWYIVCLCHLLDVSVAYWPLAEPSCSSCESRNTAM